jgi:hypothetical protein
MKADTIWNSLFVTRRPEMKNCRLEGHSVTRILQIPAR